MDINFWKDISENRYQKILRKLLLKVRKIGIENSRSSNRLSDNVIM